MSNLFDQVSKALLYCWNEGCSGEEGSQRQAVGIEAEEVNPLLVELVAKRYIAFADKVQFALREAGLDLYLEDLYSDPMKSFVDTVTTRQNCFLLDWRKLYDWAGVERNIVAVQAALENRVDLSVNEDGQLNGKIFGFIIDTANDDETYLLMRRPTCYGSSGEAKRYITFESQREATIVEPVIGLAEASELLDEQREYLSAYSERNCVPSTHVYYLAQVIDM
jgi:hypothetical protein